MDTATNTRIRLIIKGGRFIAARAAADRNIPLAFVRDMGAETWADALAVHRSKIVAWHCEPIGSPLPAGALLFYSDIREDN